MQGGANLNHTNIFLPINTPLDCELVINFFILRKFFPHLSCLYLYNIHKNLCTMKNTITTVKNKTTLQDPSSKNHHKMA